MKQTVWNIPMTTPGVFNCFHGLSTNLDTELVLPSQASVACEVLLQLAVVLVRSLLPQGCRDGRENVLKNGPNMVLTSTNLCLPTLPLFLCPHSLPSCAYHLTTLFLSTVVGKQPTPYNPIAHSHIVLNLVVEPHKSVWKTCPKTSKCLGPSSPLLWPTENSPHSDGRPQQHKDADNELGQPKLQKGQQIDLLHLSLLANHDHSGGNEKLWENEGPMTWVASQEGETIDLLSESTSEVTRLPKRTTSLSLLHTVAQPHLLKGNRRPAVSWLGFLAHLIANLSILNYPKDQKSCLIMLDDLNAPPNWGTNGTLLLPPTSATAVSQGLLVLKTLLSQLQKQLLVPELSSAALWFQHEKNQKWSSTGITEWIIASANGDGMGLVSSNCNTKNKRRKLTQTSTLQIAPVKSLWNIWFLTAKLLPRKPRDLPQRLGALGLAGAESWREPQ